MIVFKQSQGEIEETFNYSLTRPMYPYGQCCQLIKSRTAEKSLIFRIVINLLINSETKVRNSVVPIIFFRPIPILIINRQDTFERLRLRISIGF